MNANGTINKLWMVTDGEWVPTNPTAEWFKAFLGGIMSKSVTEIANGDSVAPRTKYTDGKETFIVEWQR
jgi:hypothetical protein